MIGINFTFPCETFYHSFTKDAILPHQQLNINALHLVFLCFISIKTVYLRFSPTVWI
ncbi:hypothetical protein PLO_1672 [Pediococcus acidilactici NGRI 0510Q]|nr:hypothetical protein IV82_GL000623 [Pediococcus acidilactici]GAC46200.1 hypothetical protein PLO_1672 [Pediococcus acidilactici NGRI 0510Q]